MNYGGKGIKQKKKLLNSATTKLGTKLGIFFIKLALVAAIAVVVSGSCLVLGSFQGIIENAPDIASVNVSPEGFATKIYDSDENEIQTLSSAGANRTYVTIDQIPKDLQHAFIAIEDERFYEHNGIDMRGILRAASITLSSGEMSQGASTITQQLARNIFLTQEVTWQRKIEEIFIAWGLEKKYSKEHLLMLTFIYYLKNILCINDIQTLLDPISQNYFSGDGSMDMTELYNEIMNLELKQIEPLAKDVTKKYKLACSSFEHATEEEQDFLRKFSFICMLSFDVYVKKQVIEKIIDDMADNQPKETKNKNKNSKK